MYKLIQAVAPARLSWILSGHCPPLLVQVSPKVNPKTTERSFHA